MKNAFSSLFSLLLFLAPFFPLFFFFSFFKEKRRKRTRRIIRKKKDSNKKKKKKKGTAQPGRQTGRQQARQQGGREVTAFFSFPFLLLSSLLFLFISFHREVKGAPAAVGEYYQGISSFLFSSSFFLFTCATLPSSTHLSASQFPSGRTLLVLYPFFVLYLWCQRFFLFPSFFFFLLKKKEELLNAVVVSCRGGGGGPDYGREHEHTHTYTHHPSPKKEKRKR